MEWGILKKNQVAEKKLFSFKDIKIQKKNKNKSPAYKIEVYPVGTIQPETSVALHLPIKHGM